METIIFESLPEVCTARHTQQIDIKWYLLYRSLILYVKPLQMLTQINLRGLPKSEIEYLSRRNEEKRRRTLFTIHACTYTQIFILESA